MVRVPDLHGADDSHVDPGRLENRLDEEGGAGLAVGAGYADQPELVRRVSVETPRNRRQGASRIRNQGHRPFLRPETLGCRFHQKCRGSQIQSLCQVFVAVVVLPSQGDEEVPRRDPSRVVGHAPDDRVVVAGVAELRSQVGGEGVEKRRESHQPSSPRGAKRTLTRRVAPARIVPGVGYCETARPRPCILT